MVYSSMRKHGDGIAIENAKGKKRRCIVQWRKKPTQKEISHVKKTCDRKGRKSSQWN